MLRDSDISARLDLYHTVLYSARAFHRGRWAMDKIRVRQGLLTQDVRRAISWCCCDDGDSLV